MIVEQATSKSKSKKKKKKKKQREGRLIAYIKEGRHLTTTHHTLTAHYTHIYGKLFLLYVQLIILFHNFIFLPSFAFCLSIVATPKQIRELMNVEGLTNDEVKSHLQVRWLMHYNCSRSNQIMVLYARHIMHMYFKNYKKRACIYVCVTCHLVFYFRNID